MKEKFAQKMLDERLDFLPLKESLELFESGIVLKTNLSWVVNSEEIEDNGYGMSKQEIIDAHAEIFGENDRNYLKVGKSYDEFDEFTLVICPAPTYIDLIQ